jgi:hypothetical protein
MFIAFNALRPFTASRASLLPPPASPHPSNLRYPPALPYSIREFHDTPNPAALKCVLDRPVAPLSDAAPRPRSYRSAAEAAPDPLAAALFRLPGVTNILIADNWITVGKSADVSWKNLKPALEKALASG